MNPSALLDFALSVFQLPSDSIHGSHHWDRVKENGLQIADTSGADRDVIIAFAYLHDCCRQEDGYDTAHGPRAADLLSDIPGEILGLTAGQVKILEYAIRHHTGGRLSDDPTVGACWDADRLDLGRVGMVPRAEFMSTGEGRRIAKRNVLPLG